MDSLEVAAAAVAPQDTLAVGQGSISVHGLAHVGHLDGATGARIAAAALAVGQESEVGPLGTV